MIRLVALAGIALLAAQPALAGPPIGSAAFARMAVEQQQ
jgi:hypothetical protein